MENQTVTKFDRNARALHPRNGIALRYQSQKPLQTGALFFIVLRLCYAVLCPFFSNGKAYAGFASLFTVTP